MDLSQIAQKPFFSILVDTVDGKESQYLNYRCSFSQMSCNSQELSFKKVEDLKDGCTEVHVFFEGTGDLYLLSRLDGIDDPDTENVIREGIYLGRYVLLMTLTQRHSNEVVSTIYCLRYDNALYGFYVVAVTEKCIHMMTTKKVHIHGLKPEEIWRSQKMHLWANQLSGEH